jgi:hypothetical protein
MMIAMKIFAVMKILSFLHLVSWGIPLFQAGFRSKNHAASSLLQTGGTPPIAVFRRSWLYDISMMT